jgi:hypothetical protein
MTVFRAYFPREYLTTFPLLSISMYRTPPKTLGINQTTTTQPFSSLVDVYSARSAHVSFFATWALAMSRISLSPSAGLDCSSIIFIGAPVSLGSVGVPCEQPYAATRIAMGIMRLIRTFLKTNGARHRAGKVDCPFVKPRKPGSGARDGYPPSGIAGIGAASIIASFHTARIKGESVKHSSGQDASTQHQ